MRWRALLIAVLCSVWGQMGCGSGSSSNEDAAKQADTSIQADTAATDITPADVMPADKTTPMDMATDTTPMDMATDTTPMDLAAMDTTPVDQLVAADVQADQQDTTPVPVVVADSVKDFSSTQGEKGWFYGYWDLDGDTANGDGVYQSSEFVQMTEWFADWDAWMVQSGEGGYWTYVSASSTHPNGISQWDGRLARRHWAIRRWVSTVSGAVRIQGVAHKRQGDTGGDGVRVRALIDGVEQWTHAIAADDTTGVSIDLCVTLSVGAKIDLAIDDGGDGDDGVDTTVYTVTLTTAPEGCN